MLSLRLALIFVLSVLGFSLCYWILGYFTGHEVVAQGNKASFWENLYFSVVSITTLGYGDFTPQGASRLIAALEAVFGIVFIGYSITQVLSVKQEALIEYSVNFAIHETYNKCIDLLTDAKEAIGDHRRDIQNGFKPDKIIFLYNRSNPFYSSLKAMQITNGYSAHLVEIGKIGELLKHVERAAHHVEELAGFIKNYLNLLNQQQIVWKTERTVLIIESLCAQIENFVDTYAQQTRYAYEPYKGGGIYKEIVWAITKNIRGKCE